MRLCTSVYVCIAYKQIIYVINSHNNRKQTIDMTDSEFSGFEEDGKYDAEGLSEIFSDIFIASNSDEDTHRPQHVFTDVLTPIQLEPCTQPIGVTHNLDYPKKSCFRKKIF